MSTCRKCGQADGQHIAGCPGLRGLVWNREKDRLEEYDNQGRCLDRRRDEDKPDDGG